VSTIWGEKKPQIFKKDLGRLTKKDQRIYDVIV